MNERILDTAEAIYALGARWDRWSYGHRENEPSKGRLTMTSRTRGHYLATWGNTTREHICVEGTTFDDALRALHRELEIQVAEADAAEALEARESA